MNDFERQLDRIRADLYEKTKNLTNGEAAGVANENAKKIAAQIGLKMAEIPEIKGNEGAQAL